MPELEVRLLGSPAIERDGAPQGAPRGQKAWALLAYLLCEDNGPSREQLAELLFPGANDPLGALRWNLAQLRRALGPEVFRSRSIELMLPADAAVDVRTLKRGGWEAAVSLRGLGRDLLEGMTFPGCPALETWLLMERRRLIAASEAALREAAVARLAAGDARGAVDLAGRLVGMNPYDDGFQELLIRTYAAAGDSDAAKRQLAACVELFRRELRRQPAPSVISAVIPDEQSPAPAAIEDGRLLSDRAVDAAEKAGDDGLLARRLLARGTARVAASNGSGEEGASDLARAADLAAERFPDVRAAAACEIAQFEIRCGRYQRCGRLLDDAKQHAGNDAAAGARIETLTGVRMSETGWHARAVPHLESAIDLARQAEDPRQEADALSLLGRLRLVREELGEARDCLESALALAQLAEWDLFLPWANALLGHVELGEGNRQAAATRLERAFEDARNQENVSLQAISARGVALVELHDRGPEPAAQTLRDAADLAGATHAAGVWVQAYVLDALCDVAVAHRLPGASRWVRDLRSLALRTGMREFTARAWIHQAMLAGAPPGPAAPVLFGVQNARLVQRAHDLLG